MKKMNPVVHFEMPAEDIKRMSEFYTRVFGWDAQQMGPDMGNYVVVSTSEGDEKGSQKCPARSMAGFIKRTRRDPILLS